MWKEDSKKLYVSKTSEWNTKNLTTARPMTRLSFFHTAGDLSDFRTHYREHWEEEEFKQLPIVAPGKEGQSPYFQF